jgi:hypothetical protein
MYCVCVSCSIVIYCCFYIVFVLCLCVMRVASLLYCCTTATGLKPNCSLTNIYNCNCISRSAFHYVMYLLCKIKVEKSRNMQCRMTFVKIDILSGDY